jgi:DNA-binding response OmpR family regulator
MAMKTILIVDDEIYARDYLADLIGKYGFKVLTADSGEDAIKIFQESKPDFVFLDILLPGIDGEEVFRNFKEIDPEVNVYFMTGFDDIFTLDKAKEMGGRGYFTKPIFFENVVKLLDALKTNDQPVYFSPKQS